MASVFSKSLKSPPDFVKKVSPCPLIKLQILAKEKKSFHTYIEMNSKESKSFQTYVSPSQRISLHDLNFRKVSRRLYSEKSLTMIFYTAEFGSKRKQRFSYTLSRDKSKSSNKISFQRVLDHCTWFTQL